MEIKDNNSEVWEIFICDKVFISKQNPLLNFKQYLMEKMGELEQHIARKAHPLMPSPSSHLIVKD